MREKIVVTGGAGFIGSHLVEALLPNYDVVVIDDLSSGKISNLATARRIRRFKFIEADIRDTGVVRKTLKHAAIVFHQAAKVSVPGSVKNHILANDINVNGTLNLLRLAVKNRVRRFIYASSSSVYGEQGRVPKKEQMRPKPLSPYAVSKLAAEEYCHAFYSSYGLETVSLRYFNVYGPRQRTGPYSGVINSFINRATSGLAPLIFGDGRQTRDFTHVSDVVHANVLAMTSRTGVGEPFNIGTGRSISIMRLARLIIRLTAHSTLSPILKPERAGDVRYSCADISKTKRFLGYAPRIPLEEGLQRLILSQS